MTGAAQLAGWSAAVAGHGHARDERIRLAAAQLSTALHRVEPNLRGAHAMEWALDKRWIDCNARGRAMLAATLLGSLGTTSLPNRLDRLARTEELDEAVTWGLAFRLAQRLGGNARAALSASALDIGDGQLVLRIAPDHAPLAVDPVTRDLANLAARLGLAPRIEVEEPDARTRATGA